MGADLADSEPKMVVDGRVVSKEEAIEVIPEEYARSVIGRANSRKRTIRRGTWSGHRKDDPSCVCHGCDLKRRKENA